jgi:G:T-mismatch repair DNA endonuclease (very short patch repair protein)
VAVALRKVGWAVLRTWEHDLSDRASLLQRVRAALRAKRHSPKTRSSAKTSPRKK